ncbi:CRISPR-associated protein Cas4 [Thermosipho sp. (in: thermotogales)]|uniref:CRISPR-associated protein Cas4 n=1 Tax=Thermosipho sp. (in: thermotogales) TaxID=1968895 RepID=UPI00257A1BBE|nr:CRISPR-associated protein Cas4 [Thermosipho sp. (in: thermotogales)]MBZ4651117.1 CRISPR-associated protein Cas4 [Thermosipho sp. (in: thermotogales)]
MTGTQIAYYLICQRKLWLFQRNIEMEHDSDTVSMGKLISDTTYKRESHEIHITDDEDDIVLDFYDSKTKTIHEVKKSDKMEETVRGEINYPKLKQKAEVTLTESDRKKLKEIREEVKKIAELNVPPEVINKPFCKQCAYYELCYV